MTFPEALKRMLYEQHYDTGNRRAIYERLKPYGIGEDEPINIEDRIDSIANEYAIQYSLKVTLGRKMHVRNAVNIEDAMDMCVREIIYHIYHGVRKRTRELQRAFMEGDDKAMKESIHNLYKETEI